MGAVFGSIAAGPLSDYFGRKPLIIVSDVFFLAGGILAYFANQIRVLMVARLLVGLGVGIISLVLPLYLSECSPIHIRGSIIACLIASHSLGVLLSTIISLEFGRNWRLMFVVEAIPMFIQVIWMFFLPESPRWLGVQKRDQDCLDSLSNIYDDYDAEK